MTKYRPFPEGKSEAARSWAALVYIAVLVLVLAGMAVLMALLAFSAVGMVPNKQVSENTRFLYFFTERKRPLGDILASSSIVVIGGSSPLYSIRAAQMERSLGARTINLGLQAGLGLDYLLFNAKRYLRRGDVAVLVLEYAHYFRTDTSWELADWVIPYDPEYLRAAQWEERLKIVQKLTLPEYRQRVTARMQSDPSYGDDIIESINDNGDLIANHQNEQKDHHRQSLNRYDALQPTVLKNEQLDKIKLFVAWCRSQGIEVVAGFPAFLDFPSYHDQPMRQFFSGIHGFYRDMGVPTLGTPYDYIYPKSMFFDTHYHLNAESAKVMTAKVVEQLSRLPYVTKLQMPSPGRPLIINLSAEGYPGFVDKVDGLAGREAWGRWTLGQQVRLHFTDPLPRRFTLEIVVNSAFAGNAGNLIGVLIGTNKQGFSVPESGGVVRIPVVLTSDSNQIEFLIPSATSPSDLGLSQDTRKLGIGLKSIRIIED